MRTRNVGVFFCRRVFLRIVRNPVRHLIIMLVALLAVFANTELLVTIDSYRELCEKTKVEGFFLNCVSLSELERIKKKEFYGDSYYYAVTQAQNSEEEITLVLTNDIGRYLGTEPEIVTLEGPRMGKTSEAEIAISESFAENYHIALGDRVHLTRSGVLFQIQQKYYIQWLSEHPDDEISLEEVFDQNREAILGELNQQAVPFQVTQIVYGAGSSKSMAFLTEDSSGLLFGVRAPLEYLAVSLSKYTELDSFRKYGTAIAGGSDEFILDSERLEALLKALHLIELGYPIAFLVMLSLGGVLCILNIRRDTSLYGMMQLMGERKIHITTVIVSEMFLTNILGICLGSFLGIAVNGNVVVSHEPHFPFSVIYTLATTLASLVACVVIVRYNPLILIKEHD